MPEMKSKPTELSAVGKQKALTSLFEGCGYKNERTLNLSEKGECVISHKMLLEGVDFDLTYTPLKHLGYKCALSVLGEVYVSFRRPVSLQVVIALSNRFSYEDVKDLWEGVIAAAKEHSIRQVGLDLVPSAAGLVISLAASGVQKKGYLEKVQPSKNMDLIAISGNLGAAYMGLHVLEREKVAFTGTSRQPDLTKYKYVVGQYLSPEIKPGLIERFIEADIYPNKGYFVTDGLAASVKRLVADSGFGAKVYIGKLPISSKTFEMAEELGIDAVTAVMNGGDDYRMLFTIPMSCAETFRREFQDFDIIGHLARPEVGASLVTPDGAELEIKAQGF